VTLFVASLSIGEISTISGAAQGASSASFILSGDEDISMSGSAVSSGSLAIRFLWQDVPEPETVWTSVR